MEPVREYIISIVSAALITGILSALTDKKGTTGALGKMFCGIFLAITLIRPLGEVSFDSVTDWLDTYSREASYIVSQGETMTNESTQSIIKNNCEAYIQDKGAAMGLELTAMVSLSATAPYAPESAIIHGVVPPYKRGTLEGIIMRDLAIAKEQIQWK